ncbi:1-acyl-sn-glycerol-3-phosphate acyltransferase [Patescibacteria group bacterium]|nr:MAG: 1-acyl-sn-glycerol-3-phosphate acyltransferase [Patescibacteria group bacterium]
MANVRKFLGFSVAFTGSMLLIGVAFLDILLRLRRLRADDAARRTAVAEATNAWAETLLLFVCRWLEMRVDVAPPAGDARPSIVIANHRSTLDVFFALYALRRHGIRNLRWVAKQAVAGYPLIGWMCTVSGGIYVRRNRDPRDLDDIRAGAARAAADGASPFIFVEGTRQPLGTGGFRNLGPPKRGGFEALRTALPDYPVLRLLIRRKGSSGKTMFQSADYFRDQVLVEVEQIDAATVAADPQWLTNEWRRMDALLDAAPR